MSRSLNKVMLIGNLGADPEVRSTNNGSRVANLSLATSRQWTGQNGEKQEKTEWHRVICWNNKGGQLADLAEKFMKKGDKLYVEGRVEYRTWEDRDKQTRYVTEIVAREVASFGITCNACHTRFRDYSGLLEPYRKAEHTRRAPDSTETRQAAAAVGKRTRLP